LWTVVHNRGEYPNVSVFSGGSELIGFDVAYPDANTVTLTFGVSVDGVAYLN
jgi:hypothetical protein